MALCDGSACFIFVNLVPESIVTVVSMSGHIYGPATFVNINPVSCIVTLQEEGMISPSSTNIIQIGCDNIESVIINT